MAVPPDVSVIVAVYNTKPYLAACLESLVGQTIGPQRMEILAIDDGSTDGSSSELDSFADRHPGLVKVVHRQSNSGGPASPNNQGLALASGRYVYFVGSDDYLGDEALERLVREADDNGSDVVVGKLVGVNGRYVHQALFAETSHDVDLFDSALPWTMSNVKLFRRSLVEKHGLRFREDLPKGSDQPFVLEACLNAQRISVLADYDFYFAVTRSDLGNVTWSTHPDVDLACTGQIMENVARLVPPGEQRDMLLRRHFSWELVKLLTVDFLERDEDLQERLRKGVAELADRFLTDGIKDRLTVERRVVLGVAQFGDTSELRDLAQLRATDAQPPLVVGNDGVFVRWPGFRTAPDVLPDSTYQLSKPDHVKQRLTEQVTLTGLAWQRRHTGVRLRVAIRLGWVADPSTRPATQVQLVSGAGRTSDPSVVLDHHARAEGDSTLVSLTVPVARLLSLSKSNATQLGLTVSVDAGGSVYRIPLGANDHVMDDRIWARWREHLVTAQATKTGRLVLTLKPVARRSTIRRVLNRLVPMRGR